MRNRFQQVNGIFHYLGGLLQILGGIILLPLVMVFIYWGHKGDGKETLIAFLVAALLSFLLGVLLQYLCKPGKLNMTGSMLMCALAWLFASAVGALPFVLGMNASCLDAYFEAMSGFTTTGITMFAKLGELPRSIIFWRALTQWLGGLGILSFFLAITFRGGGAHHIFGAESHKISSRRPAPGLFNTLVILWSIYGLFTVCSIIVFTVERMPVFDAVCHTLTALSTGGFSPHDQSIAFYRISGHANFRLIEYTLAFMMMLGGINFLVHYRVLTRDFKALWDNIEIRWFWGLITAFTLIIMLEHLVRTGALTTIFSEPAAITAGKLEKTFRYTIFQVISILTTTGFVTQDIGSGFFPALSKQLFLAMMVIGGCVGSTACGIKVLRVAVLKRLMTRELFKIRTSGKTPISSGLVIDRKIVPEDEVYRIAALFFTWMALLLLGGVITALFSTQGAWESFSGMFSALGNIGPCYISVPDMIAIHPVVKITYIFGMLAGRLEILPVLLLFSRKAWR